MTEKSGITIQSESILQKWSYPLWIIVFTLVVLFSPGQASVVEGQNTSKVSNALFKKVQSSGSVRVIVKLNTSFQPESQLSGTPAVVNQQGRISKLQKQLHQSVSGHNVRGIKKFKHIPYTAMEVDETALSALIANPLVVSIEEDVPVPPTLTESVPLIKADQAWNLGYTGAGWTVAILDTGVDKTHSFFSAGKIVAEACFSSTMTSGNYSSTTVCPNSLDVQIGSGAGVNCSVDCYHGTHVAGIAAGKSASINGVAKDANIISIQVFANFSGMVLSWSSDQILALEHVYSLRNTYNIAAVNMSLGGGAYTSPCDDNARKAAIDNLRSAGIATIIASGNNGYVNAMNAPACISTAVSVGATDKSDVEAYYNNYHPTMLSLFAPGSSIYSSMPQNGWAYLSGTSMAAPHVTGAWAIMKQKWPKASVDAILNSFQSTGATVTLLSDTGGSVKRIDVFSALDAVIEGPGNLTGTALSANEILLNWTDNASDETGFKIERKTGVNGEYSEIAMVGANTTTYHDTRLEDDTAYSYKVRAYKAEGNSAYSNEVNATTPLAAPGGLQATMITRTQINLNWMDNSGHETAFIIERATASGGPYTEVGTTGADTTTYEDKGLTTGATYYYRVRAHNTNGDSGYSNEAHASLVFNDSRGGSGGCFIATATYDSYFHPFVTILKSFRDRFLLTHAPGRAFVAWYYRISPPIADFIRTSGVMKQSVRILLLPLVGFSYLCLTLGVIPAGIIFLLSFGMVGIGIRKLYFRHKQPA